MERRLIQVSKFLSFVLRHRPEEVGLEFDENGWADVDELIAAAGRHGRQLTRALVEEVVEKNDKKRFTLSADGKRIRAAQGHSRPVDLGLPPVEPPEILFHGTATRFLESIMRDGLSPGQRQHVHLSPDEQTATAVGRRHGKPVVLRVRSGEMHRRGHQFYLSENGVWLTDHVSPGFIEKTDGQSLALARDQELLANIKARLPELEGLLDQMSSHWAYEDPVYRFYYGSFKVYDLQEQTRRVAEVLESLAPEGAAVSSVFREIMDAGASGKRFEMDHNKEWTRHTRPFVEAFFHARFFLEMAVKYGRALESAPTTLPSGWAALLCLYGIR